MPLPTDEKVVETSKGIIDTVKAIFGPHPGFRPLHAKGILLKGSFTPTAEAAALSKAQHFNAPSTPVIVRFSSSTGIPNIPDTDPNSNPRGIAVRFVLAETPRRKHTDIVGHSVDGFPGSNGDEILAFFSAIKDGSVGEFLQTHPKALAFVQLPKPFPTSFAHEHFFGLHAFKFIAADGKITFIRYRIVPVAGRSDFTPEEAATKPTNYLFDEVPKLVSEGTIQFKLTAQVAEEGDVTNDSLVKWPETRKVVELGTISLTGLVDDDAAQQKTIIFDPIPRVDGVEESDDPMLEVRAGVYLISGRERRAA